MRNRGPTWVLGPRISNNRSLSQFRMSRQKPFLCSSKVEAGVSYRTHASLCPAPTGSSCGFFHRPHATVRLTEEASGTTLGHLLCLKPLAAAFSVVCDVPLLGCRQPQEPDLSQLQVLPSLRRPGGCLPLSCDDMSSSSEHF